MTSVRLTRSMSSLSLPLPLLRVHVSRCRVPEGVWFIRQTFARPSGSGEDAAPTNPRADEGGGNLADPTACDGDCDGPVLRFTPSEWAAWLHGAKAGEFDHLA